MAEKQLFHVRKQEKSKYVGLEGVFHLHWPWECCFSLCIKDTKSPPQKLLFFRRPLCGYGDFGRIFKRFDRQPWIEFLQFVVTAVGGVATKKLGGRHGTKTKRNSIYNKNRSGGNWNTLLPGEKLNPCGFATFSKSGRKLLISLTFSSWVVLVVVS